MKMKVFMQAHGVWKAIEPKDVKTVINEKTDKQALAIIYQGIPEDVLLTLAENKTSKEAWEAQTLKREFDSLNMKETEQLDEFYMKLNGLVTNIWALGGKVEETYMVKKLLNSVPSKFLQIASTIE